MARTNKTNPKPKKAAGKGKSAKKETKSRSRSNSRSSSRKPGSTSRRDLDLQQFLNESMVVKLGQKAGCVRMGDKDEVRKQCLDITKDSLQKILYTAARIASTAGRKTVMSSDIIKAIEIERGVKLAYTDAARNKVSAGVVNVRK